MPYHTRSNGSDTRALTVGIAKAAELAKAAGLDVIYLCPTFNSVESDALVELIGASKAAAFKKQREMLVNGVKIRLETAAKKNGLSPAIVLAVHMPIAQIAKVEADHRTKDWVYVLWSDIELGEYEASHPASVAIYDGLPED